MKLFKGLIKHIHIEETIFLLDFSDYSHFDRSIFGLGVVEFGMTLIVIAFVELDRNSDWSIAHYYKMHSTNDSTYLYSLGVLQLVNMFINWGELNFIIKTTNISVTSRLIICVAKLAGLVGVCCMVYFIGGNELVYLAWLVINLAFCFWH